MSKHSSNVQLLSGLLTAAHFSFQGCFHTQYAALVVRYPTVLASPTSWRSPMQSRLHLHSFMCKGLSETPCRDNPDICLASMAFLSCRGKFHNLFFISLTLKPKLSSSASYQGWNMGTSFNYMCNSLLFLMISFTA